MKNKIYLILFLWMIPLQVVAKVCIPDASVEVQRKRFVQRGLLVNLVRSQILFSWPIRPCDCWVSSLFGKRGNGFHSGVDLAASKGTPVQATAQGVVNFAGYAQGYGNMVTIVHDRTGYKSRYAHLDTINVEKGDQVAAGALVGTVGSTGNVRSNGSDPSHLHFELYKGENRVDPLKYLFSSDRVSARKG